MLEANVAITMRFSLAFSNKGCRLVATVFSLAENPRLSAFVESAIYASTPFLPYSANVARSVVSPCGGV